MRFLVCISNVPDTTTKIVFTEDGKALNNNGVQFIINPYDELALTKALELKEKIGTGEVTVINVGDASTEPNLRKALAIGADNAVRIDATPEDAFQVAQAIADYAKTASFDMILTGRESIDFNGGQVGGMLAEMLDLPMVNVVTKIDINGTTANIERDIDGGKETLSVNTPFVMSAQKELTEPRIPNMRGIMTARTKPLQVIVPASNERFTQVTQMTQPPAKGGCKFLSPEEATELIQLLHNEAKVI